MIKQTVSKSIVLSRTNYQEADRIITFITPSYGKVRVLARGVRKSKSKLAGGVELFGVAEIGFIKGKGELCTLISSRLIKHYGSIATDINRTMLGYELIKLLNKVTEDAPEEEYFDLLQNTLAALDNVKIDSDLIKLWFMAQLLRLAGHSPNLHTDMASKSLQADGAFMFGYDDMTFASHPEGLYGADHIKFLRLVFSGNQPATLQQVVEVERFIPPSLQLIQTILPTHIRT